MPELPEVETTLRGIESHILNSQMIKFLQLLEETRSKVFIDYTQDGILRKAVCVCVLTLPTRFPPRTHAPGEKC